MVAILEQLYKFTDLVQGDGVTISAVVPALRSILHNIDLPARHADEMKKDETLSSKKFHFEGFIISLRSSLLRRFYEILKSPLQFFASILDLNYGTT